MLENVDLCNITFISFWFYLLTAKCIFSHFLLKISTKYYFYILFCVGGMTSICGDKTGRFHSWSKTITIAVNDINQQQSWDESLFHFSQKSTKHVYNIFPLGYEFRITSMQWIRITELIKLELLIEYHGN